MKQLELVVTAKTRQDICVAVKQVLELLENEYDSADAQRYQFSFGFKVKESNPVPPPCAI